MDKSARRAVRRVDNAVRLTVGSHSARRGKKLNWAQTNSGISLELCCKDCFTRNCTKALCREFFYVVVVTLLLAVAVSFFCLFGLLL